MEISNPHDKIVKHTLSNLEYATGFLKNILPVKLAKVLDWPRLALEPGSFLDDNLREYHSDLLYSVTFIRSQANSKESKLGVYLLIEHKSEPDRHVHTQVLSYLSSIYKSKGQIFPVIPIVYRLLGEAYGSLPQTPSPPSATQTSGLRADGCSAPSVWR